MWKKIDYLTKYIFYHVLRWKLTGFFPDLKKCVVIVVPHTSWHDFYMGLIMRRLLKKKIKYIAKKELFKWPFGWYFRWTGGTAIDRTPGQNKVEAIAALFSEHEEFILAMSPEGTRKKVTTWKTGFYYIAKAAEVPIVMIAFDYGKKEMKIAPVFYTTEDVTSDFSTMERFFKGVKGKVPKNSF